MNTKFKTKSSFTRTLGIVIFSNSVYGLISEIAKTSSVAESQMNSSSLVEKDALDKEMDSVLIFCEVNGCQTKLKY